MNKYDIKVTETSGVDSIYKDCTVHLTEGRLYINLGMNDLAKTYCPGEWQSFYKIEKGDYTWEDVTNGYIDKIVRVFHPNGKICEYKDAIYFIMPDGRLLVTTGVPGYRKQIEYNSDEWKGVEVVGKSDDDDNESSIYKEALKQLAEEIDKKLDFLADQTKKTMEENIRLLEENKALKRLLEINNIHVLRFSNLSDDFEYKK